jgi:hypothetical protein
MIVASVCTKTLKPASLKNIFTLSDISELKPDEYGIPSIHNFAAVDAIKQDALV